MLSVTQFHAGDAYNVIPDRARLSGTVRTLSVELMQEIETRVHQRATSIAAAHGGTADVDFRTVFHPVVNDEAVTQSAADVCRGLVGDGEVITESPPGTGSEDFSFMSEQVPSCYLILGNGGSAPLHNSHYDFNDEALVYGASFFAGIVEHALARQAAG